MAAYSLFEAFRQEDADNTFLVAGVRPDQVQLHAPGCLTKMHAHSNEWLYHTAPSEWLFQHSNNPQNLNELANFIAEIQPDIVHVHHYIGFGLDLFRILRRAAPNAKVVLTLHEYLAICPRDGQMLTNPNNRLCTSSSSTKCRQCFPQMYRSHFALRDLWFRTHFDLIDGYVCPSEFLRDRYQKWGLSAEKMAVLENAQWCVTEDIENISTTQDLWKRFAFFGQFTPYKGVEILIRAAQIINAKLSRQDRSAAIPKIQIYGTFPIHSGEYSERLRGEISAAGDAVEYRGGYSRETVMKIMKSVGWVVVPSVWWENSPVVIEEAFHANRPVICSNIGGMREKVRHDIDGIHFAVGDSAELAEVIEDCVVKGESRWTKLRQGIRRIPPLAEVAARHREFYEKLDA